MAPFGIDQQGFVGTSIHIQLIRLFGFAFRFIHTWIYDDDDDRRRLGEDFRDDH